MDFDAIIAEAKATATAQPETNQESPEITDAQEAESEAKEQTESEKTEAVKAEDELSKKAVNIISKKERRIGQLTAQKHALQRELEQARNKSNPEPKTQTELKKPNPDDFKTWGEYLDARDEFNEKRAELIAEKKLSESKNKDIETKAKDLDTEIDKERVKRRAELADEARVTFPDFDKVMDKAFENVQLLPHVIEAIDEAERGTHALYALAKSGYELTDLNDLTPAKAAMLIARYEDKGNALSKQKQVTNAPAPLSPNKGNGSSSTALANKSTDELMKWAAS